MALPVSGLYSRVRHRLPELLKFGVVGGIGSVIDLGGAAVLHGKYHVGPLESKAISTAVATVVTYVGSRFWTFKDRENQSLRREAVLFILLNLAGLLIAEVVIAFVTYVLGLHSQLEYNASSVLGTGLATIFRYFAYREWVFTAPAEPELAAMAPATEPFPDYPPWEFDPAYQAAAHAEAHAHGAHPQGAAHAHAHGAAQAPATYSRWQPADEQRSWQSAAEHREPWMDNQVTLPNERVTTSPILTAHAPAPTATAPLAAATPATAPGDPAANGQDIGQDDSLSSGPRSQGRHRKP